MPESTSSNAAVEPEAVKREPFAKLPKSGIALLAKHGAGGMAWAVCANLLTYARDGHAWSVGYPRLASDLGISVRSVRRAIVELVALGIVERTRAHKRAAYTYRVRFPAVGSVRSDCADPSEPTARIRPLRLRGFAHPREGSSQKQFRDNNNRVLRSS